MTVYETIMVVLGVIGALISLSKLVIALLNFLDKRNSKRMSLPKPLFTAILSLSHDFATQYDKKPIGGRPMAYRLIYA